MMSLLVNLSPSDDFPALQMPHEPDNEAVLGSIVLVLGLGDHAWQGQTLSLSPGWKLTLAGVVVGLALSAALVLDLVATEVR